MLGRTVLACPHAGSTWGMAGRAGQAATSALGGSGVLGAHFAQPDLVLEATPETGQGAAGQAGYMSTVGRLQLDTSLGLAVPVWLRHASQLNLEVSAVL